MSAAVIPFPQLARKVLTWPERANALVISSLSDVERASSEMADMKALEQEIHAHCDPGIAAADKLHKSLIEDRKKLLAGVTEARQIYGQKTSAWHAEQKALADAESARIAAEARQKREREEKAAREEREQADRAAAEAKQAGDDEAAAAARIDQALAKRREQAVVTAPAPVVRVEPPKVQGLSFTERWDFEVTDFKKLVIGVAEGRVPLEALLPNEVFLRKNAIAQKADLRWDGVAAVRKTEARTR